MGVVILDTFTDANGTLLQNHVPNVGNRWAVQGAPEIQGNKVVKGVGSFGDGIHQIALPGPEYDVNAVIQTPTDIGSVFVFRVRFASSVYIVFYSSTGGWTLQKEIAGITTTLDDDTTYVAGTSSHTITFEVRDTLKRLLVDGVQIVASTDNDIPNAGLVAFRLQGDMTLDNFSVVSAGEKAFSVENRLNLIRSTPRVLSY